MRKVSILLVSILFIIGCQRGEDGGQDIAVFVPGFLEGSPTYEMMDAGTRDAAKNAEITVKTIEGGFDQATWEDQLMLLASEGRYELIVTSNPAMPEICRRVTEVYPDQEFLILDGAGLANDSLAILEYDHREQAFLIGYFAGLATAEAKLPDANDELKVGMIVGQEYPVMNQEIRPGFEIGLHTAQSGAELEFRVLGNWYDVDKARQLAAGLYADGVDLILTIAGNANQGVITAAKEAGAYVLWFDSDGYDLAPGIILGSAVVHQERAARELVDSWIKGSLPMGRSRRVGVADGYVDFLDKARLYRKHTPKTLQRSMDEFLEKMRSGSMSLRTIDE